MKFKEKICEVKKEELRKKYLVWRQKSKGKMKNDYRIRVNGKNGRCRF